MTFSLASMRSTTADIRTAAPHSLKRSSRWPTWPPRPRLRDDVPVRIRAPLLYLTKAEIIRHGLELGVDYSLTTSCYDPSDAGEACGHCDACLLRQRGFREAGAVDPIRYVAEAEAELIPRTPCMRRSLRVCNESHSDHFRAGISGVSAATRVRRNRSQRRCNFAGIGLPSHCYRWNVGAVNPCDAESRLLGGKPARASCRRTQWLGYSVHVSPVQPTETSASCRLPGRHS